MSSAEAGNVTWIEVLAKVLTVSDSVAARSRVDRSADAVEAFVAIEFNRGGGTPSRPDGVAPVATALTDLSSYFVGLIVTTGGTGFSQTDLTPEATRQVLEREAPGMAEVMGAASPLGPLSRGVAGTVGSCLILNLPGSVDGAVESLGAVLNVLSHAVVLLAGGQPH